MLAVGRHAVKKFLSKIFLNNMAHRVVLFSVSVAISDRPVTSKKIDGRRNKPFIKKLNHNLCLVHMVRDHNFLLTTGRSDPLFYFLLLLNVVTKLHIISFWFYFSCFCYGAVCKRLQCLQNTWMNAIFEMICVVCLDTARQINRSSLTVGMCVTGVMQDFIHVQLTAARRNVDVRTTSVRKRS